VLLSEFMWGEQAENEFSCKSGYSNYRGPIFLGGKSRFGCWPSGA